MKSRRQPAGTVRVESGNPINAGLVSFLYPVAGGLWDAMQGRFIPKTAGTGGLTPGIGITGKTITGSDGGGTDSITLASGASNLYTRPSRAVTVLALVERLGNNSLGNAPILLNGSGGSAPYNQYNLFDKAGVGLLAFGIDAGGAYAEEANGTIPNNVLKLLGGTYDGTTIFTWMDGVKQGAGTAASGAVASFAGFFVVVGNFATAESLSRTFNGKFYGGMVYDRALTASEQQSLVGSGFWRGLEAPRRRIVNAAGAAALFMPAVAGSNQPNMTVAQ